MEMQIKYPHVHSLDAIKKEIHMTEGKIESRFTYPNGFAMETIQSADGSATIRTSAPLIDNGDGTFTIPD